jgi:hypothetical protein
MKPAGSSQNEEWRVGYAFRFFRAVWELRECEPTQQLANGLECKQAPAWEPDLVEQVFCPKLFDALAQDRRRRVRPRGGLSCRLLRRDCLCGTGGQGRDDDGQPRHVRPACYAPQTEPHLQFRCIIIDCRQANDSSRLNRRSKRHRANQWRIPIGPLRGFMKTDGTRWSRTSSEGVL